MLPQKLSISTEESSPADCSARSGFLRFPGLQPNTVGVGGVLFKKYFWLDFLFWWPISFSCSHRLLYEASSTQHSDTETAEMVFEPAGGQTCGTPDLTFMQRVRLTVTTKQTSVHTLTAHRYCSPLRLIWQQFPGRRSNRSTREPPVGSSVCACTYILL